MKVSKLIVKNIGMIADATIELNKALIIFYGEIRQGKTTILNAVRWVFGGSFPSDIIRHGEKSAFIELAFEGGSIRREFYIARDETTKARDIKFVRNGKLVENPVSEIKRFLNPFLLDQDYLRNMGEVQRKAYFTELFAVDTSALDAEAMKAEQDARDLRSKIKGYGDIDLTEVKPVDVAVLRGKLAEIKHLASVKATQIEDQISQREQAHNAERLKVEQVNRAVLDHNASISRIQTALRDTEDEIFDLEEKLKKLRESKAENEQWLANHPAKAQMPYPDRPDTSKLKAQADAARQPDVAALESQIIEAGAVNVRAEQYQSNLLREQSRRADQTKLAELEKRQREIKSEKAAKLKGVADTCGIAELAFDEEGNFTYQNTSAGMLSTSQVMKLSSELSALYPPGFSIELLDRGESLGRSIFEFIDRAKREEKTILATVVGERPAQVPDAVGVFVVSNGAVTA